MHFKKLMLTILLFFVIPLPVSGQDGANVFVRFSELPEMPDPLGVAGPFAGISGKNGEVLIIAGGANFPRPFWETDKVYYGDIWVLEKNGDGYTWHTGYSLDRPDAYGAAVTTAGGVLCIGGRNADTIYGDVFLLKWNSDAKETEIRYLPSLAEPCAHGYAAVSGNKVYLAGGQNGPGLDSAMKNFWVLELSAVPDYAKLNGGDLLKFCNNRGIEISIEDRNELEQSVLLSDDIKSRIVDFLQKSDRDIARIHEMPDEQIRELAAKRLAKLNGDETVAELKRVILYQHWNGAVWRKLPAWPGPERAFNITAAQHNGYTDCIYVFSGRRQKAVPGSEPQREFLTDMYEFAPANFDPDMYNEKTGEYRGRDRFAEPWKRKADLPQCVMAGPGIDFGQSHIFTLGGDNGLLMDKANDLRENHPGFPKKMFAYHTITDTWIDAGYLSRNQVTTVAVKWDGDIVIPSGEVKPRERTPKILKVSPIEETKPFGWLNYTALVLYLLSMVGIGVYFAGKNKDTNDYFRGGQNIPWWAAGCSIFATMLSSLTYMAVPSKAFATNWEYLLGYPQILLVSIFVVFLVLPFFRKIDATSAYEYLEKRFNRAVRLIASALFIMFQIGRMAIVMFLSAIALAAITPFTPVQCILIMGLLSIIYCTLGGVEAVVWTDTIQTFVLMGGAFLILGIIFFRIDGGFSQFISIAVEHHKFTMVNWNWDSMSYTTAAFWVIILGSIGQNIVSYSSDQAVVQRYMTTPTQKQAGKAILANGIMAIPSGLLFFGLGAALFVFYRLNPAHLDPTFNNDGIMPLFIVREVPAGLAGLIVAGIFAAAQSTISTSMNSTATSMVTDFLRPFKVFSSEKGYLNAARGFTVLFGVLGTCFALLFASADVKSLMDEFFAVIGLFGGSLGGLFMLGMFTRRTNGPGAIIGAIAGAAALYYVKTFTNTHIYVYATVGITACFITGYITSLLFGKKSGTQEGLTIYTINLRERER